MTHATKTLADDLPRGADAIACFVFGSPREKRKIYHLAETARLPVFRMGNVICARRSTLIEWVAAQERKAMGRVAMPDTTNPVT